MSLDFTLFYVNPVRKTGITPKNQEADVEYSYVGDWNVTHNLITIAHAIDVYDAMWRPDENGITLGKHMIAPLTAGLARVYGNETWLMNMGPPNGWGTLSGLVDTMSDILVKCKKHPNAKIGVSR